MLPPLSIVSLLALAPPSFGAYVNLGIDRGVARMAFAKADLEAVDVTKADGGLGQVYKHAKVHEKLIEQFRDEEGFECLADLVKAFAGMDEKELRAELDLIVIKVKEVEPTKRRERARLMAAVEFGGAALQRGKQAAEVSEKALDPTD